MAIGLQLFELFTFQQWTVILRYFLILTSRHHGVWHPRCGHAHNFTTGGSWQNIWDAVKYWVIISLIRFFRGFYLTRSSRLWETSTPRTWSTFTPLRKKWQFNRLYGDTQRRLKIKKKHFNRLYGVYRNMRFSTAWR
jgi:hypothetical protein